MNTALVPSTACDKTFVTVVGPWKVKTEGWTFLGSDHLQKLNISCGDRSVRTDSLQNSVAIRSCQWRCRYSSCRRVLRLKPLEVRSWYYVHMGMGAVAAIYVASAKEKDYTAVSCLDRGVSITTFRPCALALV